MVRNWDVCVFGIGPAGAAVTARLADAGAHVMVLNRPTKRERWGGESFTGGIRQPLESLGLWGDFLRAGHIRGYEQRTGWGGTHRVESSILRHHGNIWHVDRGRFDKELRDAVLRRGVPILNYRQLETLRHGGEVWHLSLDEHRSFTARYLVDATGRTSALAKRLGFRPKRYDRLVGLTAVLPRNENPEFGHSMLIDTTPDGWWYAAPVPQGHVLSFFTDADLVPGRLRNPMRTVPANSAFTESDEENGWINVGDACAAHDPLCGWGVCRAMTNGIMAADAMCHYLEHTDLELLRKYRQHCRSQFESYLTGLGKHYSYEQRWTSSIFWERRMNIKDRLDKDTIQGELHA